MTNDLPRLFNAYRLAAIVAVVAGVLLCASAFQSRPAELAQAYLAGFLFWWSASVGCLGIWMLYYLVGGRWGEAILPLVRAGAATVALAAVILFPLLLNLGQVYPWAMTDESHPVATHLARYLSVPVFRNRAAGYFAVWFVLLVLLWGTGASVERTTRLRRTSALGLVLLVLTTSFAAIDWGMSLTPHWYSTMYPVLYLAGGAVSALAALALVASTVALRVPNGRFSDTILADLGTLLMAFVMLWTYVTFSQYLIVWCGNIPEEATWYVARSQGGWQLVMLAVAALGFVVPFAMLLSRDVKQSPRALAGVAAMVLAAQALNILWMIAPEYRATTSDLTLADLGVPLALGGAWALVFVSLIHRDLLTKPLAASNHA